MGCSVLTMNTRLVRHPHDGPAQSEFLLKLPRCPPIVFSGTAICAQQCGPTHFRTMTSTPLKHLTWGILFET